MSILKARALNIDGTITSTSGWHGFGAVKVGYRMLKEHRIGILAFALFVMAFLAIVAATLSCGGWILMLAWGVIHSIFHTVPTITFWQAVLIYWALDLLFSRSRNS